MSNGTPTRVCAYIIARCDFCRAIDPAFPDELILTDAAGFLGVVAIWNTSPWHVVDSGYYDCTQPPPPDVVFPGANPCPSGSISFCYNGTEQCVCINATLPVPPNPFTPPPPPPTCTLTCKPPMVLDQPNCRCVDPPVPMRGLANGYAPMS